MLFYALSTTKGYIRCMARFDLHITSIPDSRGKLMVARALAANPAIPLHVAMEMTSKLPVTLYKDLEIKEAEAHIVQLKKFGVGFKLSESSPESKEKIQLPPIKEERQLKPSSASPPPLDIVKPQINHPETMPAPKLEPAKTGIKVETRKSDPHRSGIFVGEISETPKKQSRTLQILIPLVIVLSLAALLSFLPKEKKFVVSSTGTKIIKGEVKETKSSSTGKSSPQNKKTKSGAATVTSSGSENRGEVGNQERKMADSYLDSAVAASDDAESRIAFYKIAISFNKYNISAWQGLLETYRELDRIQEARETQQSMEEIFGAQVFSTNSAVKQFGELTDAYLTEGGAYRVEYRSNNVKREAIFQDIYLLTRALRTVCKCERISIFATTGPARGMLVHTGPEVPIHSVSAFSQTASVVWLE